MEIMNIKQISNYFGGNIGRQKITELIKSGQLPAVILNGTNKYICKKEDIVRLKEEMFTKPNEILNSYPL